MPTTSLGDYQIHNVGALTTTFTAPKSCSTGAGWEAFGVTKGGREGQFPRYELDCNRDGFHYSDCYPNGSKIDEIGKSLADEHTWAVFYYHSPGLDCPSGWDTIAEATMMSDGKISTSGDFYDTGKPGATTTMRPMTERIFVEALDKGETAALCCPSGYTAGINGIQCYSEVSTSISKGVSVCDIYSVDETTIGTTTTALAYEGTTLSPDDIKNDDLALYSYVPMVTLVHRESDKKASSDDSDQSGGDDEDMATTNWGGGNILITVWGAAALVGAMLMM